MLEIDAGELTLSEVVEKILAHIVRIPTPAGLPAVLF
jgi:hypothetical protein